MDYMGKQFFQSFDCIVKPAGFERYPHGYIRIVNDVMHYIAHLPGTLPH